MFAYETNYGFDHTNIFAVKPPYRGTTNHTQKTSQHHKSHTKTPQFTTHALPPTPKYFTMPTRVVHVTHQTNETKKSPDSESVKNVSLDDGADVGEEAEVFLENLDVESVPGDVVFPQKGEIVDIACGVGRTCKAQMVSSGDGEIFTVLLDDVEHVDSTGKPLWETVLVQVLRGDNAGKVGEVVKLTPKMVKVKMDGTSWEITVHKSNVFSLHKDIYD